MIAAGVQVLRKSGVLYAPSLVDPLVVRRILETALPLQKISGKTTETSKKRKKK
jgi:hypothetical protein